MSHLTVLDVQIDLSYSSMHMDPALSKCKQAVFVSSLPILNPSIFEANAASLYAAAYAHSVADDHHRSFLASAACAAITFGWLTEKYCNISVIDNECWSVQEYFQRNFDSLKCAMDEDVVARAATVVICAKINEYVLGAANGAWFDSINQFLTEPIRESSIGVVRENTAMTVALAASWCSSAKILRSYGHPFSSLGSPDSVDHVGVNFASNPDSLFPCPPNKMYTVCRGDFLDANPYPEVCLEDSVMLKAATRLVKDPTLVFFPGLLDLMILKQGLAEVKRNPLRYSTNSVELTGEPRKKYVNAPTLKGRLGTFLRQRDSSNRLNACFIFSDFVKSADYSGWYDSACDAANRKVSAVSDFESFVTNQVIENFAHIGAVLKEFCVTPNEKLTSYIARVRGVIASRNPE